MKQIYPFLCNHCSKEFDVELNMDDRNEVQSCPECGSNNTIRKLVPTMIRYLDKDFTLYKGN